MATVGGGEGLVESLGRFSSRVKPIADNAGHPMSSPSGTGSGSGAVFTVSSAAAHSQVGLKKGEEEEGRRGARPRQAW